MKHELYDDVAEWNLASGAGLCMDIEAWLERYIADRVANGVSDKTVSSYRDAISTFIEYIKQYENVLTIGDIGAKVVNNYLMWYQARLAALNEDKGIDVVSQNISGKMGRNDANVKIAPEYESTLSHRLTIIKQLFSFISQNNKEQHDLTRIFPFLSKIKIHQRATKYLTPQEMNALIEFMQQWPSQWKNYKRRDEKTAWQYALIALLYCYTAARADEVLSLKIKDITESSILHDGKYELFYIIGFQTTKGNKYRESAVKKELIEVFVEKVRALIDEDFYISSQFIKRKFINKKIADSTMYRFITWALASLGINKSGRHIIRRGYATNELAEGKDIGVVALDLGHESTHTTIKHYVKNNAELMMKRKL